MSGGDYFYNELKVACWVIVSQCARTKTVWAYRNNILSHTHTHTRTQGMSVSLTGLDTGWFLFLRRLQVSMNIHQCQGIHTTAQGNWGINALILSYASHSSSSGLNKKMLIKSLTGNEVTKGCILKHVGRSAGLGYFSPVLLTWQVMIHFHSSRMVSNFWFGFSEASIPTKLQQDTC